MQKNDLTITHGLRKDEVYIISYNTEPGRDFNEKNVVQPLLGLSGVDAYQPQAIPAVIHLKALRALLHYLRKILMLYISSI